MDVTLIADLITSFGFPIAAVIALCIFIWRIYKRSEDREDKLREEIKENQATINQAMTVLAQYVQRIDTIQADVSEIKQEIAIMSAK